MIGAQRGFDQVEVAPDDGVVVDVRHLLQRILDLGLEMLGRDLGLGLLGRVEAGDEQREQRARDLRIAVERRGDEALALRNAGLLQIAAIGAQDGDLARPQAGGLGERVVAVIVDMAAPDRQEHVLEQRAAVGEVDRLAEGVVELHVVDEDLVASIGADLEGALADDAEAHVFEHRHAPRQRHRRSEMVDLQRRLRRPLSRHAGNSRWRSGSTRRARRCGRRRAALRPPRSCRDSSPGNARRCR